MHMNIKKNIKLNPQLNLKGVHFITMTKTFYRNDLRLTTEVFRSSKIGHHSSEVCIP